MVNGTASGETKPSQPAKKSISEIAKDVIAGKYGNGADRQKKLEAEGYNFAEVQAEVNRQLGVTTTAKKSVSEIAEEVIAGKWGNGADRKNRLTQAGYDYNAVQTEVNKRTINQDQATRQFAREVWYEGKHGTGATREAEAKRLGIDHYEAQLLINILASGGEI